MQNPSAEVTPGNSIPAPSVREDSAVHVLADVINHFVTVEFENTVARLHGLGLLIQNHPAFQQEVEAIRKLVEARDTLIAVTAESRSL